MQDCWSFYYCLSCTLGSLPKSGQLKSFLQVLGRCSSDLFQPVPRPYSRGKSTQYSDGLHDFCVTIPRRYQDAYVSSFFPWMARVWNYLTKECFPMTYDLNGFKSRINRHLSYVGSFQIFPVYFNLFVSLFLVTPWLGVAVQSCIE